MTPLQLASAQGGLWIGGTWYRPHLVKNAKIPQPRHWALNPEHVQEVVDGMYGVVNEGGTGVRARLPGIEVCGKTGTAQLASNEFLKGKMAHEFKDNAWFIGYAPRQAPEIVVAALFENGEHGQLAAPIVRDVLKAYFDKKARLALAAQPRPPILAPVPSLAPAGRGAAVPESGEAPVNQ